MRIFQLTPGTGSFYCGSCMRDEALVRGLRALGHDVLLVPLYLPLMLEDHAREEPGAVHMGGINMYLQQKLRGRHLLPRWLEDLLDRPRLLRWASTRAGMTAPEDLGAMTVSMLRGEEGRQVHELEKLVEWLAHEPPPDVLFLSNALLTGMARALKSKLGAPIACTLQGEAPFLDGLPEPWRARAWEALRERAQEVDRFVPVSAAYGETMRARLGIDAERLTVVHNGIEAAELAAELAAAAAPPAPRPTIGYLARMCADKGLPTLVEAFVRLRARGRVPGTRLVAAGVLLPEDRALVRALTARVARAGLAADLELRPNLERADKLAFLRELSVLSVPATYGESFGLYLLEALAAGVPVVQPACDAFPELVEATGGGVLCPPDDPEALSLALEELLLDPDRARALGARGRAAVLERFTVARMARDVAAVCQSLSPA